MFKVVSWQGQSSTLSSLLIFDARKRLHAGYILPSSVASSRISLVTFASIHCSTLSDPVRCSLLQLGFPIPSYEVIQPTLYGCNSCALPRMRQLSLSDVCRISSAIIDQHDVIEVVDSQDMMSFECPRESDRWFKQRLLSGCTPCKMEDTFLEIVQPMHLKPFVPLAAQEIHDYLCRMPFPVASWAAAELRHIIRECKKSHWYYNRVHDLWTYLDSLDFVVSQ